ncbi:hypothetical protein L484_003909 [Morus notabilis]|uniref:Uncharacterized protein n=1 Tax=Morus notabilis TaxID=981085 RepID=W9RYQ1_9ROSA|nr:hypothetical protein L484_003909 [Morus notabilis]
MGWVVHGWPGPARNSVRFGTARFATITGCTGTTRVWARAGPRPPSPRPKHVEARGMALVLAGPSPDSALVWPGPSPRNGPLNGPFHLVQGPFAGPNGRHVTGLLFGPSRASRLAREGPHG